MPFCVTSILTFLTRSFMDSMIRLKTLHSANLAQNIMARIFFLILFKLNLLPIYIPFFSPFLPSLQSSPFFTFPQYFLINIQIHHYIINCIIPLLQLVLYMLLFILLLIWGFFSFLAFAIITKTLIKYSSPVTIDDKEQLQGFIRSDFGKWPIIKIYIGAILYFPFKVFIVLQYIICFCLLLRISSFLPEQIGAKSLKMYATFQFYLANLVLKIKEHEVSTKIKTPIIVSNHVCWLDILYLLIRCWPASFVAKSVIRKIPLVGRSGERLQCVYVDREKSSGRQNTLNAIKERIDKFSELDNKNSELMTQAFPLIIFPEGTTTDGRTLVKFKTGAFQNLSPVTVMCLHYECDGFSMGMDQISQVQHTIISLCLSPSLQVKQFEMSPLQKETGEEYAARCKEEMSKVLGYPQSEAGFRAKLKLLEKRRKKKSE